MARHMRVEERRGDRRIALLFLLFTFQAGCVARPPREQVSGPPPVHVRSPSPPPEEKLNVTPELPPDRFARLEAVRFHQETDLVRGVPQTLSREELVSWTIPVANSTTLTVALDANPPRRSAGRLLRLVDLLNEDEEISPGSHWLTFVEREGNDVRYQLAPISVELQSEGIPSAPGCLLITNGLTFNGSTAASTVQVMIVPVSEAVNRVLYEVQGPNWQSTAEVAANVPLQMIDPPSGDLQLKATCFFGDERLPPLAQTLTINREMEGSLPHD